MMPFQITPEATQDKAGLLRYFRERGEEKLSELRQEIGNQNHRHPIDDGFKAGRSVTY
jgi:hypothetical protein